MPLSFARIGRLSASDWYLLAGAALSQVLIAYALRVMTLPGLRAMAARLRPLARVMLRGSDDRVIWAVEATGRRLPRVSTCLVRAIVVQSRLSSPDRPLRLTIGCKRASDGDLAAHAWIVDGQRVLTGGPVDAQFVPMVVWEGVAA
jgi:hypothetical protein